MDANSITEAMLTSMGIMIDGAVSKLDFNKTELCEIVDITQKDQGFYTVYNGSVKYLAFSENQNYKIGMKVYVNIPNNDYTGQKTIIGQYKREGESPVFYKSPLKGYTPVSPDVVGEGYKGSYGLTANGIIDRVEIANLTGLFDNKDYNGHKYLGISAEFKSLLKTYNCTSGDYGIVVYVDWTKKLETNSEPKSGTNAYPLDSSTMFGDIYNFDSYYPQEALFNIEDIGVINSIRVVFYQSNNFKNGDKMIPHTVEMNGEEREISNNIFVRNISVRLGEDQTDNGKDDLKLYTLNGETYDTAQNEQLNAKNLYVRWRHRDGINDEFEEIQKLSDVKNATIYWYQDSLHSISEYRSQVEEIKITKETIDNIRKWKDNPTDNDSLTRIIQVLNLSSDKNEYTNINGKVTLTASGQNKIDRYLSSNNKIDEKAEIKNITYSQNLAGNNYIPLENYNQSLEYKNFNPDITRQDCTVKVVIEYGNKDGTNNYIQDEDYERVVSNELKFTNLTDMTKAGVDMVAGLTISIDDKTGGKYPLYSSDTNMLLDRNDINKTCSLTAHYVSKSDGSSFFNGNETIIWKAPIANTMIKVLPTHYNDAEILKANKVQDIINESYDSNYIYIKRNVSDGVEQLNTSQSYNIDQCYNKNALNNTITCYVIKNNSIASASISMEFSQHGSSGTDYTFNLSLGELVDKNWNIVGAAESALTVGETNWHKINFSLFDSKNDEIELTNTQKHDIINKWITYTGYFSGKDNAKNLDFITKADANNKYIDVAVKAKDLSLEKFRYIILQASAGADVTQNDLGRVTFTQYLPIHVRTKEARILTGPDYICYDDKGSNPQCVNDAYSLSNKNAIKAQVVYFKNNKDNVNSNSSTLADTTGASRNTAYPVVDENNKLVPVVLYLTDNSKEVCVDVYSGSTFMYTCPLLIIQNKYQVPLANQWNGQLQIDKEGNSIMAATMGAGHKNSDNTFTGVFMGDLKKNDSSTETGLFGFDKGSQVFELNTQGKLTLGASGYGQIVMNGTSGTITSGGYSATDKTGTKIDLQNGVFESYGNNNFANNGTTNINDANWTSEYGYFKLSTKSPYLQIASNTGNQLIHIANGTYYLQSNNYVEDTSGMRISLNDGKINAANFKLKAATSGQIEFGANNSDSESYINITGGNSKNGKFQMSSNGNNLIYASGSSFYIQSKDYNGGTSGYYSVAGTRFDLKNGAIWSKNFSIDQQGNARFKGNGEFEGKITASSGTIGGWEITENGIKAKTGADYNNNQKMVIESNGHIGGYNWDIDKNGNAVFNTITCTGTITANAGAFADGVTVSGGTSGGYTTFGGLQNRLNSIYADYVNTTQLDAVRAKIDSLDVPDTATINNLIANNAVVGKLKIDPYGYLSTSSIAANSYYIKNRSGGNYYNLAVLLKAIIRETKTGDAVGISGFYHDSNL